MLKNRSLFYVNILFMTSFIFMGCGGSSTQSTETAQTNKPEAISIQVTPHILKIAYLPRISSDGGEIYSFASIFHF